MKWSRFALGLLPALPVAVVAVVLAIVDGSDSEPSSEAGPSAEIVLEGPSARAPVYRVPRRRTPRLRTAGSAATADPPEPASPPSGVRSSKLQQCCAELKRYRRATVQRYRALYDEVIDTCTAMGQPAFEGDDEPMVAKIRATLQEQNAPYVPPSCR